MVNKMVVIGSFIKKAALVKMQQKHNKEYAYAKQPIPVVNTIIPILIK